jgi:hypothetical protein
MYDGLVQLFLNIEGQSGVGNNILKIAFLIFPIQGFVLLLVYFCFLTRCLCLLDFRVFEEILACIHARFK